MRKKIIDQDLTPSAPADKEWLDLDLLAEVEVTSEDPDFPIEEALTVGGKLGWRASKAGLQTIRLIFDEPQRINRIHLLIQEEKQSRTQEFVLRWAPTNDQTLSEIVRQQYNFNPENSTQEQEDYTVKLDGVKVLELSLLPDMGGSDARASLSEFWVA